MPISACAKMPLRMGCEKRRLYRSGNSRRGLSCFGTGVLDYLPVEISSGEYPMRRFSIPRWLMIAMAALLAMAIFVIVVHPYYDVASATLGTKMAQTAVLLTMLLALTAAVLVNLALFLASAPRPQPLPIVERNCSRRI